MKRLIWYIALGIILIALLKNTQLPSWSFSDSFPSLNTQRESLNSRVIESEESTVVRVVEKSLPSVVTISALVTPRDLSLFDIPFPFRPQRESEPVDQNIGSGFILSADGLIITNRHVVTNRDTTYKVITNDKKEYQVTQIYRDRLNDLAILKIEASGLKPLALGDSARLKLGQMAIAIGTPLGEFQNTVTSGIVSGLGRGITAGSPFEGYVEKLDDVIQTDAAISPGNSGGPLLNSSGQVIGVNTAVASEGQNIGFAIPINIVKQLIKTFEKQGGNFQQPYIGVRYQMVDRSTALRLDIAEGAYVEEVLPDSPAESSGVQQEDIITAIDGKKLKGSDDKGLGALLADKKVGEQVILTIWREGDTMSIPVTLAASDE